jgi:hypothetical protein
VSEPELEAFLRAFRDDWIKAGQPGPSLTIAMVKEIERLRNALAAANALLASR